MQKKKKMVYMREEEYERISESVLLPGFETCDLNSGRTARLASADASHFLVTYNADVRWCK